MSKTKNLKIVPVRLSAPQKTLFPDMFTEQQERLLALADGSRTLSALAETLSSPLANVENLVEQLLRQGHFRPATVEEMQTALRTLPAQGRHEDAIRLAQFILSQIRGDIPTLTILAHSLETTARPQEAAAQWQYISQIHTHEGRMADALLAARKAAALQPFTHTIQNALAELCLRNSRPAEAVRCWCAYARRLADNHKTEEALAVLDYAQSKIPNDDLLMFTEAEILAVSSGHPRKTELPPHLLKKKFLNNPRLSWSVLSAVLVIFGILGAITLGTVDYVARERQFAACDIAEIQLNNLASLPLAHKTATATQVLKQLTEAAPFFKFLEIKEFRQTIARAQAYLDKTRKELQKSRQAQAELLQRWRAHPAADNEDLLSDLLLLDDPESPSVHAARGEWKKWRETRKRLRPAESVPPALPAPTTGTASPRPAEKPSAPRPAEKSEKVNIITLPADK